jgi:colanic acid/amylovoran biosynthesis glycosyltransferase
MSRRILYISPTLPILTCTFIYREIFDLRDLGLKIDTVSMNTPARREVSGEALELLETTLYLDKISELRKFTSLFKCLILKPVATSRCIWLFLSSSPMKSFRDYLRLGYHLIEACYLAYALKDNKPDHIHSHFITGPTSLGMFLSELIAVPFSFTMHASLIWIDPLALRTKLRKCKFCVSISQFNKNYVVSEYGQEWASKIHVVHCGIRLPAAAARQTYPDDGAVSILAVGQLMKRKGFHVLVAAAKLLKERSLNVSWTIVGEGEQRAELERLIAECDVSDVVTLAGAQPHEAIPRFLSEADIFTLPCVIGDDSTRDGIPVAMMEAMAWSLPVVSTDIVGLPELIESGSDGVLVKSGDATALAAAIEELAKSPEQRQRIGEAAARKVDREFNATRSAAQLATLFGAG